MAWQEGQLYVGTAPVAFVDPGIRGALIMNVGQVPLWIGGPQVVPRQGPQLGTVGGSSNTQSVWIYGAPIVGAGTSDFLYAVAAGTAGGTIAWVAPV